MTYSLLSRAPHQRVEDPPCSRGAISRIAVAGSPRMQFRHTDRFRACGGDGVVYIGSENHKVYALKAATGKVIWSFMTGSQVQSSPTVSGGIVYVGSNDGKLYALNATPGAKKWSYTTGGQVSSSPAFANGTVYVGSYDGYVYALKAGTGALVWKYLTSGGDISSSPALANNVVYITSETITAGTQFALNASTGASLWSYPLSNDVAGASPAVANGMVYFGTGAGYAVDAFGLNQGRAAAYWTVRSADSGVHLPRTRVRIKSRWKARFRIGLLSLYGIKKPPFWPDERAVPARCVESHPDRRTYCHRPAGHPRLPPAVIVPGSRIHPVRRGVVEKFLISLILPGHLR